MSAKKQSGSCLRPWWSALRQPQRWLAAATLASLLVVSVVPGAAFAVEPWPHIDEPPKGSVQWVARSMLVNGVPTSVMQFNSPLSLQQIADYYKTRWSQGYDHPPSVHHVGDATVIGQMHGSYLLTVKVSATPDGGSQGLLSVAQVLGAKAERNPGTVPVIAGAHVLSVVDSEDTGQHSHQVLMLASQSPAAVADYYQAALTNSGWHPIQANDSTPPGSGLGAMSASGSFLAFAQNDQEIQISIAGSKQGGGTSVLANVITHGAGDAAQ